MIPWLPMERRWRDALMAAVLPRGVRSDGARPGFGELDLAAFWPRFAAAAPPLLRLGLRVAVWTLTFAPPLLLGRLRRFGGLDEAARDQLLCRAASHRRWLLRQLALTLKLVACFAYFQHPEIRRLVLGDEDPARRAAGGA